MHHAHTPEIDILDESSAQGLWYLEDFVISALPSDGASDGTVLDGTGIYLDVYRKSGGAWQIAETGCDRIFQDVQPRAAGSRLKTRWDAR